MTSLVQVAGFMLAMAATTQVACEARQARPAGIRVGAAAALRVFLAYVAMVIVSGLTTSLGALLLIVPGLVMFCRWSVATPALVVERAGILGSLRRSRDLTRHHGWTILGFFLVVLLVDAALFIAFFSAEVALGRAVVGPLGLLSGRAIVFLLGLLANAAVVTINGASTTALYVGLRRAGEGALSVEMLEAFS